MHRTSLLLPLFLACHAADKGISADDSGATDSGDSSSGDTTDPGDTGPTAACLAATAMVDAANALTASFTTDQAAAALFMMDAPERKEWSNLPVPMEPRTGLPFSDMTEAQVAAVHTLLQASLSEAGTTTVNAVFHAEDWAYSNGDPVLGTPYFHVAFFGTPTVDGAWGWQLDGHHLVLNFTLTGCDATFVPAFYGASPVVLPSGDYAGEEALAARTAAGFALLASFDETQRATANLTGRYGPMMQAGPEDEDNLPAVPEGLCGGDLPEAQRALLLATLEAWILDQEDALAVRWMDLVRAELDDTCVGYVEDTEYPDAVYYRIHGPSVWIEFDHINGPNHIHGVLRDPLDDYGEDLLARHYSRHMHPRALAR